MGEGARGGETSVAQVNVFGCATNALTQRSLATGLGLQLLQLLLLLLLLGSESKVLLESDRESDRERDCQIRKAGVKYIFCLHRRGPWVPSWPASEASSCRPRVQTLISNTSIKVINKLIKSID